jgi:DNA-binding MarR family transcriptional regulator
MQVTDRTPRASAGLAAQLDGSWQELARFLTSRRMRTSASPSAIGDLTPVQLHALGVLAQDDLRMSELASRLDQPESTVTRLVDRMEAAGLVRRRASQPDRRCVVAELTPGGRRLAVEIERTRRQFLGELLATLPPAERRELVRLTGKVTEALRERDAADARR